MTTRSIYVRLIGWYATLLIAVFVLLGVLIFAGLRAYLVENQGQTQARRAQQMAETLLANVDKTGEAHVVEEINSWVTPRSEQSFRPHHTRRFLGFIRFQRPAGREF